VSWDDLTLPLAELTRLKQLSARLGGRNRRVTTSRYGPNRWKDCQYLFHGPSGTDKLLAAQLVAGDLGLTVSQISCTTLVERYIGETEKNLDQVFERAGQHGWVLFFDEADALFGKRTGVSASRSRYANQEVSYLLGRAEQYRGIVILSTQCRPRFRARLTGRFKEILEFS